jgi:hypothetical protein
MENNVVSLFNRRPAPENELNAQRPARASTSQPAPLPGAPIEATQASDAVGGDFAAIAERNRQIQDKLRKEREQANKAVLKSYRIK